MRNSKLSQLVNAACGEQYTQNRDALCSIWVCSSLSEVFSWQLPAYGLGPTGRWLHLCLAAARHWTNLVASMPPGWWWWWSIHIDTEAHKQFSVCFHWVSFDLLEEPLLWKPNEKIIEWNDFALCPFLTLVPARSEPCRPAFSSGSCKFDKNTKGPFSSLCQLRLGKLSCIQLQVCQFFILIMWLGHF